MMTQKASPEKASTLLDHRALVTLFDRCGLALPAEQLVIIALRGCLPASTSSQWRKGLTLNRAKVDYRHMRCSLVIWDTMRSLVFGVPGSTVPNERFISASLAKSGKMRGKGVNQMEPGFYRDLIKGEHLQGKPRGHLALRQSGGRFYRRPDDGIAIGPGQKLYFGNPYDNLHCAWNLDPATEGFSSSGCLVVAGWPHSPRLPDARAEAGHWKHFREILYESKQQHYPLLLLPFTEAFTMDRERPIMLFGSQGEVVRELQKKLKQGGYYKGTLNGKMDTRTYRSWQKARMSS